KKAPVLAGFLEQSARAQKLEVTDSVDRPEVPHGKRYVERNTVIHLKKAGMYPIAKFIESLEKSGYAVAVTRLAVRKRSGETDAAPRARRRRKRARLPRPERPAAPPLPRRRKEGRRNEYRAHQGPRQKVGAARRVSVFLRLLFFQLRELDVPLRQAQRKARR